MIPIDFKLDEKGEALRHDAEILNRAIKALTAKLASMCLELEQMRQDQWFEQQEKELNK